MKVCSDYEVGLDIESGWRVYCLANHSSYVVAVLEYRFRKCLINVCFTVKNNEGRHEELNSK